jgi:hypothetical protein
METNHAAPIYGLFNDHGGTGVDPATVRLFLNGTDITADSQVSDQFVTCSGHKLIDGLNQVVVTAKDRAGNYTVTPWSFTLTSLDNRVHSVEWKAVHNRQGERVLVSLEGVTGGDATFDIGPDIHDMPMKETRPGHYEGVVALQHGDKIIHLPVTGRLHFADGLFLRLSDNRITYLEGKPSAPVVDSPVVGSQIQAPLVVFGHADPGVTVHVKVEYDNKVLAFFGMRGFSSEQNVPADEHGQWRTGALSLGTAVPNAHHLVYRISCEAINAAGVSTRGPIITAYRDIQ